MPRQSNYKKSGEKNTQVDFNQIQTKEYLNLFKKVVANSTDAIGISSSDGRHWYQNAAFEKLFGEIGDDPPATLYYDESVGREVFETIMAGGEWIGEVQMYSIDGNILDILLRAYAFLNENGEILGLVGVHTDITVNKQANKEIKQNEKITRTLFSISNAVNTTENLDDLYRSIYDSLNLLIDLPNFFIAIVDSEKKLLSFPFFIDEHDTQDTITKGLEKYEESTSNTSQVIRTKSPIVLKKNQLQRRLRKKKTIGTVAVIWIGVPLIVRNEAIGVMVTQHYSDPEYFTQNDLNLLISVSDQVALAIDRKQSQEEIKQKEKITQTLFSISNAVNITPNLNNLYQTIHSLLGEIFDVTNFFIAILDNKKNTLHFPYYEDTVDDYYDSIENFDPEGSLTGLVVSKRNPIFLTKEELTELSDKKSIQGTTSLIWMGVPLVIKDEVIGVIAVQSYTDPYLYNKEDLKILTSISDQVAIAIDRKRTEDELRKSEKKYRYLFNNAPAGMYEIDFIQQKFIEVNGVLCRYTGYSEDELLSIKPLALLTDKSKKQFIEDYETVVNGGKISNNVEYDILTKDGQELCVLLNSDFVYDDGKLIGAGVVVHDITKRKKIEKMIIQSEKMMSIGGLAAGMAHEINNPLSGMMQNAQVIKNRLTSSIPANDKAALESETTMNSITKYMKKRKILSSLDHILDAGSNAAKIVDNMGA
jgi:PAS domain S-box-containing protein